MLRRAQPALLLAAAKQRRHLSYFVDVEHVAAVGVAGSAIAFGLVVCLLLLLVLRVLVGRILGRALPLPLFAVPVREYQGV